LGVIHIQIAQFKNRLGTKLSTGNSGRSLPGKRIINGKPLFFNYDDTKLQLDNIIFNPGNTVTNFSTNQTVLRRLLKHGKNY
jgi:hypothetical protein